jgi:hypothetical protein
MEAGGRIEAVARQRQHEITGNPAIFSEVRVGMAAGKLSSFGNAVLGLLDIETVNPTCIE